MVKSCARFTPFARGLIVGKRQEGATQNKIRKEVLKKDGTRATLQAIDGVLAVVRAFHNANILGSGTGKSSNAGCPGDIQKAVSISAIGFLSVGVVT